MASDLYAPPTPEELKAFGSKDAGPKSKDLYAPPTPEELKAFGKKEPTGGDTAQAAIEGVGQGGLMGYLPQAQAMAEPTINRIGDLATGQNVTGEGKLANIAGVANALTDPVGAAIQSYKSPDYIASRDENIARQKKLAEQSPGAYYGGMVGGVLGTAPMLGGAMKAAGIGQAAKGAGLLQRLGAATEAGAVTGALQNPGDTEGEKGNLQLAARGNNAVTGGALGAAFQAGGEALSKGIKFVKGIPDLFSDLAEKRAASSTGIYKGEAKRAIMSDMPGEAGKNLKDMGRFALDNKIIQAGDTIEEITNKSSEMKRRVGQQIGAAYEEASTLLADPKTFKSLSPEQQQLIKSTNFHPRDMADEYLAALEKNYKGNIEGKQIVNAGKKLAANIKGQSPIAGIQEMQDLKVSLDGWLYDSEKAFEKTSQKTSGFEAFKDMRDFVKQKIDARVNAIDSIFGKSIGADLKQLNKDYGMVSKISTIAKGRLAAQEANSFLSMPEKLAAAGGAASGGYEGYKKGGLIGGLEGAALGAGIGLVGKAGRTYGMPAVASGLNVASKLTGPLKYVPQMAAQSPAMSGLLGGAAGRAKK